MSAPARDPARGRPRLTVVHVTRAEVPRDAASDWRRVADAVLGCTRSLREAAEESEVAIAGMLRARGR